MELKDLAEPCPHCMAARKAMVELERAVSFKEADGWVAVFGKPVREDRDDLGPAVRMEDYGIECQACKGTGVKLTAKGRWLAVVLNVLGEGLNQVDLPHDGDEIPF